jgi:hypothetical protein
MAWGHMHSQDAGISREIRSDWLSAAAASTSNPMRPSCLDYAFALRTHPLSMMDACSRF